MPDKLMNLKRRCAVVFILALVFCIPVQSSPDGMRQTMAEMLANVSELLRLASSKAAFAAPTNAERVIAASRGIEQQANVLAEHMGEGEAAEFLSQTLERYAFLLERSYKRGETDSAQRLVFRMTDVCIACHTRLPSHSDSPLAGAFMDEDAIRGLAPRERAVIQMATRQFAPAMDTLEEVLESPIASDEVVGQTLLAYLIVGLRVKDDPTRLVNTLSKLLINNQLSSSLRERVVVWIDVLRTARQSTATPDILEVAHSHLRLGEQRDMHTPGGGLVDYVLASRLLHRFLEQPTIAIHERAEANYLLGAAEFSISPGHWLPQTELYLEIAIILNPNSQAAAHAYKLLSEKIMLTYDGQPPEEVDAHLSYLRDLMSSQQ